MIISTEWSLVWSIACVAFLLLLSFLLYQPSILKDSERLRKVLFFLRFGVVFVLSFFLLKPYITQNKLIKKRPIVNIGVDNSTSMVANADSLSVRQDIQQRIDMLSESLLKNTKFKSLLLAKQYNVPTALILVTKNIHAFFNELSGLYKKQKCSC